MIRDPHQEAEHCRQLELQRDLEEILNTCRPYLSQDKFHLLCWATGMTEVSRREEWPALTR